MTLATKGLKVIDREGKTGADPASRSILAKTIETVTVDLENIERKLSDVESKVGITELGEGSSSMDVSNKPTGLYSFRENGTVKVAAVIGGNLIVLQQA